MLSVFSTPNESVCTMQQTFELDIPVIDWSHSLWYRATKRTLDLVIASMLIVVLTPILLACAFVVWRSSPGPILFRQRRVGVWCREFTCLKFRTMYADADSTLHQQYVAALIKGDAEKNGDGDSAMYKLVDDPRITRGGRWLRRMSLDELPQLFNVVKGEMSLVGPRPPIRYEVEQYMPEQMKRLVVKPGMTGLWQISGRSRTTFDEMVTLDLTYIEHASLWSDLRILFRTVPVVLFGRDGQ